MGVRSITETVNVTSTPFQWPSSETPNPNPIVRLVQGSGNNQQGMHLSSSETWSRASQSDNVSRAIPLPGGVSPEIASNNPLPLGGQDPNPISFSNLHTSIYDSDNIGPGATLDPNLDPSQVFAGTGTASASSGDLRASQTGTLNGQWNLFGLKQNSTWAAIVGEVSDALHSELDGDGNRVGKNIWKPIHKVTQPELEGAPVPGIRTVRGVIYSGWGDQGEWDADLDSSIDSTIGLGSNAELLITRDATSGNTSVDGNSDGGGAQFVTVRLNQVDVIPHGFLIGPYTVDRTITTDWL